MTSERFKAVTGQYGRLRIAVAGDFCLDRYLEIDPAKEERSIETGLAVHNVTNIRSQPGGAGTIVNNLAALGVAEIFPVGFAGRDGEGFELLRALAAIPAVGLDHFIQTGDRHTFTYSKPLIIEPGKNPRELNRLDQKNWTPTPQILSERISAELVRIADKVDSLILLNQVDQPDTGVLTGEVLKTIGQLATAKPQRVIVADSRCGLRGFPPVIFKMNASELAAMKGLPAGSKLPELLEAARDVARQNTHAVFVTLAERGIIGATPEGATEYLPALPVHGEIDVVGAGDSVTANLAAALTAGAGLRDALELANAAASIVIHQLGTTGTASVAQLRELVLPAKRDEPDRLDE